MNLLKSKAPWLSLLLILSLSYPINAQNTKESDPCDKDYAQMNNRTRTAIVENPMYGATLAWKKPYIVISRKEDQLGLIESGAKVNIICEVEVNGIIKYVTKVEILEGRLKGEVGWVASSNIKIR